MKRHHLLWVLLLAVAVVSLANVWTKRLALVLLFSAMSLNVVVMAAHFAFHNPLPVVFGLESREHFLDREVPGKDYQVFRYIEEQLPTSSRLLLAVYYLDPRRSELMSRTIGRSQNFPKQVSLHGDFGQSDHALAA